MPWVIVEDVRQDCSCDARCFHRRVAAGVFERVGEDGDEAGVVGRLRGEVGCFLVAGEEDGLRRERAAVRLNPTPAAGVQGAMPNANPPSP